MKRTFCIIICFIICSYGASAQLQIEEYGQAKTMRQYEKDASLIYWIEDGYYIAAWDYDCAKYNLVGNNYHVLVYLGKNKEEVKRSQKILNDWFYKAPNHSFIYVTNPNGQKVCLYRYNSLLYCSYGTEYLCKSIINKHKASVAATILSGFTDATTSAIIITSDYEAGRKELLANIEFGEHILTSGISFKKDLIRSFENFSGEKESEFNNRIVSDLYTQRIINKINAIYLKYKKMDLIESILFQSYRSLVNPYMRSEKHKDWMSIELASEVLDSVIKNKTFFTREEIESELAVASSTSEIETIFRNYSKKIY